MVGLGFMAHQPLFPPQLNDSKCCYVSLTIQLDISCDTMGYVRQADDLFVCFGAKPKQRAWARNLPRDRKWTRRGRSERRQKVSWQRRVEETPLFSPTLSVVFYVAVMKCVLPRRKPLDESLVMNGIGLKKLISRGGRQG